MNTKQVGVRIQSSGGDRLKAELQGLGADGSRALKQLGDSGSVMGSRLQNVGFQVQDFAVQVAGGTDASRALAQQLPQLLSGFGLVGVALGTATAILVPFAKGLFDSGESAEGLSKQLDELAKAQKDYEAALKASAEPMSVLIEQYGLQAAAVRDLQEAQVDLRRLSLTDQFNTARGGVSDSYGDLKDQIELIDTIKRNIANAVDGTEQQLVMKEALEAITEELGMSEEAARRLSDAVSELSRASGPDEIAAGAANARTALIEAANEGGSLASQLLEGATIMAQLEQQARDFASIDYAGGMNSGAAAADGLAVSVDGIGAAASRAVGQVQGLLASIGAAWNATIGMMGARAEANRALGMQSLASQYSLYGSGRQAAAQAALLSTPLYSPPSIALPSRRGGVASAAQQEQNELMREAERIYADTRTEAEKYNAEVERLNELHEGGYISTETFNRAMQDLGDKTEKAGGAAKRLTKSFEDAFVSIITGAKSGKEALADLASMAAEMLARSAIQQLFGGNLFGGGGSGLFGGLFANADGNAFAQGNVVPFANGGIVSRPMMFPMRGKIGLMGEAGPEAIMPLTRIGGKLGVRAAGGGVTVPVSISVDARGAQEGVASQIALALREELGPKLDRRIKAAVADGRRRGQAV